MNLETNRESIIWWTSKKEVYELWVEKLKSGVTISRGLNNFEIVHPSEFNLLIGEMILELEKIDLILQDISQ